MQSSADREMSMLRRTFWPIRKMEHKKFIPMLLIYSLIVFNYSILKSTKDALVITAPHAGAAAIPFIKVWAILPMALLSTYLFTRLANRYSREQVFYWMMGGFLGFFFLFSFVLFPYQDVLHPHRIADIAQKALPEGFTGLIAIFRNWTFTLFYVMSELWGTMIMTVLFWGFANEVTSVKEAKRFYAILGVGANLATVLAGQVGIFLSSKMLHSQLSSGGDRWHTSLMMITTLIVFIGMVTVVLYRLLAKNVFSRELSSAGAANDVKPKIKMGLRKSFAYLANSKYLISIAMIVLAFNISLNMIEIVWKDQVHQLFPYPADYNIYMGKVLTYIGVLSTLVSIFICGQVIRRWGWTVSAYLTPIILLVTGFLFFAFYLGQGTAFATGAAYMLGTSPLVLCAFLGAMQNTFSRAAKFTFFDVTKEIAFIPLNNESKLKGKAAIDGVGSRLGKSGGSTVHQCLLMIFGSVSMSSPYVAAILALVFVGWLIAVRALGRRFHDLSDEQVLSEREEGEAPKQPKVLTPKQAST